MKLRDFARYWMPVVIWVVILAVNSTDLMSAQHTSRFIEPFMRWLNPNISVDSIVAVQLFVRKAAHVTEYAILAALLLRGFSRANSRRAFVWLGVAWLVALSCAGLDEFHQSFVASRTGSPVDVMIDGTGALIGILCYRFLARNNLRESLMTEKAAA